MRGGDDHHALGFVDLASFQQFDQRGQGHAGVRAVEHAGAVTERGGIGEFRLAGLFDDAVELLQRADGLLDAYRVADLDGAGEGFFGADGLERFKMPLIRAVKRVCPLGLGDDDARQFRDEAEVLHHPQPFAERGDVAEVAAGNDDDIRHFPVELLDDFDADGLLAFDPEGVHRIGQVKGFVLGDFLDEFHAAVEVGVEIEHERAVGDRLDKLGEWRFFRAGGGRWTECRRRRNRWPARPRCRRLRRRRRP